MSTSKSKQKDICLKAVRILFSGLLVLWLVSKTVWSDFFATLTTASPLLILFTCILYYIGVALSCWKWQVLLLVEGIKLDLLRLFRWYLIGAFVGNYLPTEVGGDVGRAVVAGRATGQPIAVIRSIFIERLSGLVIMALLAWIGIIVLTDQLIFALTLLVGVGMALLAFVLLLLVFPLESSIGRWIWSWLPERFCDLLVDSKKILLCFKARPVYLLLIFILSLMFQMLAGIGVWINMRAVGAILPLETVVLAAALAGVAGLLPISLNGWGVREGLLITLLAPYSNPATVLAGALIGRFLLLIVTLPGGALIFSENKGKLVSTGNPSPTNDLQRPKY